VRIVFMGTPEFAVPSLSALIEAGYTVAGVFCQPDRPVGRGNRLAVGPVKALALEKGIPVFQPERIKRPEGVEMLRALQPDLVVTAAFGQILSKEILDIPPMGTVNVHASLLPQHRGAAPINWCIMMGEKVSGVTTMYTDVGLDTGDMLLRRETPIGEMETAGELTERLSHMGAELLIETLRKIEEGSCPRVPQDEAASSYQGMLDKRLGQIDWKRSAQEIACQVRGLNPWPGAYTAMAGGTLKIWLARALDERGGAPGEVITASGKEGLIIACGQGCLEVLEMQAPNSKRMSAKAYLLGKPMPVGTVLGE
jgi:methionyl-tRNA formyltransferase